MDNGVITQQNKNMNLPDRNNNPGNLRFIGQAGASQGEGGFARFNSEGEGYAALMNDLQAKIDGKSSTGLNGDSALFEFTQKYAPQADGNNPGQYAADLANILGVTPMTKLSELANRVPDFAQAVARKEGATSSANYQGFNPKPFSSGEIDFGNLSPASGGDTTGTPNTPANPNPTLMQELQGRASDIGQAVSDTYNNKINPLSMSVQTVGAVAGGLGDIIGKGLELIPGVKQVEGGISQVVQNFIQTPTGQAVAKSVQDFTTQHPELSKDIGAGFNIITALPILDGIGKVGSLVADTVSKGLEDVSINTVAKGLEEPAMKGSYKATTDLLKDDPTLFKDMVSNRVVETPTGTIQLERVLPTINNVGGRAVFDGQQGLATTWDNINNLSGKVNDILSGKTAALTAGDNVYLKIVNPEDVVNLALKEMPEAGLSGAEIVDTAKKIDPMNKALWDKFASGNATLDEVNQLRSSLGGKLSKTFAQGSYEMAGQKEVATNIYQALSEYIKTQAPETRPLFEEMSNQFKFQKGLKLINGKSPLNKGLMHYAIKAASTGGGVAIGSALGGQGVLGGAIGLTSSNAIENSLERFAPKALALGALKRTATGAVQQSVGGVTRGIGGLLGAALTQKAAKSASSYKK